MTPFNISLVDHIMTVSFGDQTATNGEIVKYVKSRLDALISEGSLVGGTLLKITGPCSLPVAFTIARYTSNYYGAVAVFDPKLQKFVICSVRGVSYEYGDLLDQ